MSEKKHKILEKSLLILEYISKNPQGVSLTDICTCVEMPKSSAHILLLTMVNMKYIKREIKSGLFTIDIKSFEVGSRYFENNDYYRNAREVLEGIVEKTGETAHLAVLEGTDVIYISKFDCSHAIRMVSFVGKRIPAHATAIGKALLSGLSDEKIRQLYQDKKLEKLTQNTIDDIERLLVQIQDIRLTGIAHETEESTPGVKCFAALIGRTNHSLLTAISIAIPISRQEACVDNYINALLHAKSSLQMLM